ncbi:MAG: ZIP family metal transporter [Candidatus Pacebacteria bacterium]|nr:ZIP family metal transporter [Candidatus Paceibacterota bacterium]
MIDISQQNPVLLALIASIFTWGVTAIGAAGVFFFKTINRKILDGMLGFTAGVMIAASFWSLLAPAIEVSKEMGMISWMPAAIGFLSGGIFLWIIDKIIPHLHLNEPKSKAEGIKTSWHKTMLLFLAVTLHNFPEGLAIGVAFGAASAGIPGASFAGAIALAVGIGIQNFPEGFAVAIPFRREGETRFKSFMYGQGSALVEPVAAVLGAFAVTWFRPLLPYTLAFAAGAMIFVTVEEIIPESQKESTDIATIGAMIGFTLMMILDVALG